MAVIKEVAAVVGKYTAADGKEKNQYVNMGKIITTKTGNQMLKIDSIPVNWDGWAYLNDPRQRDEQPNNAPPQRNDAPVPEDQDIPF